MELRVTKVQVHPLSANSLRLPVLPVYPKYPTFPSIGLCARPSLLPSSLSVDPVYSLLSPHSLISPPFIPLSPIPLHPSFYSYHRHLQHPSPVSIVFISISARLSEMLIRQPLSKLRENKLNKPLF